MTKVSIILPTFRMGGLDLTKYSLLEQSFKDFELVLVDELYDLRKGEVREYFKGINLKHVPPFRINGYFSSATTRNTGILCAEGELIIFTNDYTWFSPDCVERHWNAYSELEGKYAVTGTRTNLTGFNIVDLNALYAFGSEIKGKPDSIGFVDFVDDRREFRGAKILEYFEINLDYCYADNSSIPLETVLTLNGFDVHFDGGPGYVDVNFFTRAALLGCKAVMDPDNIIYEVATYITKKGDFKTFDDNGKYHHQNIDAIEKGNKAIEADNPYSLRSLRKIFNIMGNNAK